MPETTATPRATAAHPEADTKYEVVASAVAGHPRGAVLRRDQLLPLSGSIARLLEVGAIRPARES